MYTFLVAIAAATAAYAIGHSIEWGPTFAVLTFIGVLIYCFRKFGKKLQAVVEEAQQIVLGGRAEVEKLIQRAQSKPMGSQKMLEEKAEKMIADSVRTALISLDTAEPLFKWVAMGKRQISTVKMQWLYQIKAFDEADPLMAKAFEMDPLVIAMKMARAYMKDADADLEPLFKRGTRKFKGDKGLILYSLMAWINLKRKNNERALEILVQAKERTESTVIRKNWEHVVNNKVHMFSNAGLGDAWYSLHLEKPPRQKAGKGQLKSHPMYGRGKRRFV